MYSILNEILFTLKLRINNSQKRLVKIPVDKPSISQAEGGVKHAVSQSRTHTDQVTAAEVIWALKVSSSGYSFSLYDGTVAMFQEMFPGDISKDFTMSKAKFPTYYLMV